MSTYFKLYENIDKIDPTELKRVAGIKDPEKVVWPKGKKYKVQLGGTECSVTTSFTRLEDRVDGTLDAFTALSTMLTRDEVVERMWKEDPNGHTDAVDYAYAEFLPGIPTLSSEEIEHRRAFTAAVLTLLSNQETMEAIAECAPRKKNGLFHKGRIFKIGLTGLAEKYSSELIEIVGKSKDETKLTISVLGRNTSPDELEAWNQDFISTYHAGLPISEALKKVYKTIDPDAVFEGAPVKKVSPAVMEAEAPKKSSPKKDKASTSAKKDIVASKDFVIDGNVLKNYKGKEEIVSIPDGIKTIDKNAFSRNYTIKKVIMPDSITSIKDGAFRDCGNLEEVVISKKLTSLAPFAFAVDSALKTIDLSNTKMKTIRKKCFISCNNLESIQLPNTLKTIEDDAFNGTAISEYHIPASVDTISGSAFGRATDDIYFLGLNAIDFSTMKLGNYCKKSVRIHCQKDSELWRMIASQQDEIESANRNRGQYMEKLKAPELVEL